jgi:hypothetical protein
MLDDRCQAEQLARRGRVGSGSHPVCKDSKEPSNLKISDFKLDISCQTNDKYLPSFQNVAGLYLPKNQTNYAFFVPYAHLPGLSPSPQ